jgi:NAD(P) transhydrogenase subunit beta
MSMNDTDEMREINDDLDDTAVVLVIEANDSVNPAATETRQLLSPGCPSPGLGCRRRHRLQTILASGHVGVPNALFSASPPCFFGDSSGFRGSRSVRWGVICLVGLAYGA